MTYCTATAVIPEFLVFPQTTTVQRYTETSALITLQIVRADNTINSYIGRRYSVPFVAGAIPPKIVDLSVKLSAYYALQSKFTRDNHNTNDWVEKIGEEVIKELELIRDRKIDLVNTAGASVVEKTAASRIKSSTEDYQPFADVDDEKNWRVPNDRINAIDRSG